ncbi:hypothetical protein G9A89_010604 [Geosiphon pyriformis]|nr:hypothetical protein G9A89_010604 [Geosiphon pyriformis]
MSMRNENKHSVQNPKNNTTGPSLSQPSSSSVTKDSGELQNKIKIFNSVTEDVPIKSAMITARVFRRSANQMAVFSVWIAIIILISSALMFYIERGEFDQEKKLWYRISPEGIKTKSHYQSIFDSFWWAVVTITTTGYGDAVPYSPLGKFVTSLTMFCGMFVIALPTSILGSNFIKEWDRGLKCRQKDSNQEMLQKMLQEIVQLKECINKINPSKNYKKSQINYELVVRKNLQLKEKLARWKRKARNIEHSRFYKNCGRTKNQIFNVENTSNFENHSSTTTPNSRCWGFSDEKQSIRTAFSAPTLKSEEKYTPNVPSYDHDNLSENPNDKHPDRNNLPDIIIRSSLNSTDKFISKDQEKAEIEVIIDVNNLRFETKTP